MNKTKIQIGVALVLSIFYTLPWIAFAEHSRLMEHSVRQELVSKRIVFLFLSVFLTTLFFFQYNLRWRPWLEARIQMSTARNLLANTMLVTVVCAFFVTVTNAFIVREVFRSFWFHYLARTSLVAFVCFLVCHVLDLVSRLQTEKLKSLGLEKKRIETELEVLKAQINPHFLFNSLTSLSVLIREDTRKAIQFVNHLSGTFRYILEKRKLSMVSLKEELTYLESYLYMMRQRFSQSLDVSFDLDDRALKKNVPQFALQLAVENAIKHNFISAARPLIITIVSSGEFVAVRNNKQLRKNNSKGYGIGLHNLYLRYFLLQGKEIQIFQTDSFYEVKLPLL